MANWTRRQAIGALALAGSFAAVLMPAKADDPVAPKGAVILTIAGDIDKANRGATEPKRDGFFAFHEITFDRAFAFDLALLDTFPLNEITAQPPQYSAPAVFRGPLLRDVLKAMGAEDVSIQTRALDGFAVDLTASEIAAKDWTLATTVDGRPFGIGGQGPVWLMHTPSSVKVADEEEQRWPWALFFIKVSK